MTEQEWLECTDATQMLSLVGIESNERKLRLFACGCCRRVSHLWVDLSSEHMEWDRDVRDALRVGELMADGKATEEQIDVLNYRDDHGMPLPAAFLGCARRWDQTNYYTLLRKLST